MKYLFVAIIIGMTVLGSNSLTVYDREELIHLKQALRSQLDELEAQTILQERENIGAPAAPPIPEYQNRKLAETELGERENIGAPVFEEREDIGAPVYEQREETGEQAAQNPAETPSESAANDLDASKSEGSAPAAASESAVSQPESSKSASSDSASSDSAASDSACPAECAEGSVCCRKDDAFHCCAKIYRLRYKIGGKHTTHNVEVDHKHNSVKFYLGSGGVGIIDFKKSIATVYIPAANACYIISGASRIRDAKTFVKELAAGEAKNETIPEETIHFKPVSGSAPVEDLSIIPDGLQKTCKDKPVYWTEKVTASKDQREYEIGKRGVDVCLTFILSLCVDFD